MIVREIVLEEFLTHVSLTKTKLFKISTQGIYNSKLHYHSRSKVVDTIKTFIKFSIANTTAINPKNFPLKIHLIFYAPINWGNVRMSKGVLRWTPAKSGYHPVHDLDNLAWVWGKTIQDCLVERGIIPEDTVEFINRIEYQFISVENFNDRKIVVRLISGSE